MSQPVKTAFRRLTTALAVLLLLGAACSASPAPQTSTPEIQQQPPSTVDATQRGGSSRPTVSDHTAISPAPSPAQSEVSGTPTAATSMTPSPILQGSEAHSARVRFLPRGIELPSGDSAVVEPVQTVNGALQVPDDIRHVGWWDGSSYAGDPFGSTVIAGHVDSRQQGLGFFAELLIVQVGDLITLRSDTQDLTYRVVATTLVQKEALGSESQAFDQSGPHRLVLITCSGQWHPELRSYDSNLVVIADPVVR